MLRIVRRFGKHFSCHLQSEYIAVGRFWRTCVGQAAGGELYLMVVIGGAGERAAVQLDKKIGHPLQMHSENDNCSVCRNVGKLPQSLNYTLNSSRENLGTRLFNLSDAISLLKLKNVRVVTYINIFILLIVSNGFKNHLIKCRGYLGAKT
jgi:hypothetical protein